MSTACIICHKRKVKCDLRLNDPCTNCRLTGHECRPHPRKRKRYTNSVSPSRRDSTRSWDIAQSRQTLSPRHDDAVSSPNATIQPSLGSRDPGPCTEIIEPSDKGASYMGREEYLPGSVPGEIVTTVNPGRRSSNADLEMLRQQNAFEMPPKVIQDALVNSFMKFCEPWMPIVDSNWLDGPQSPSPLLLQSIFLAGSRVSSVSQTYASSQEFYRRAKLFFFFGSETNPIISLVSAILLQWYNPVGPENVSTDTSGFWIRTAGAIAFQIGLHKEPPPEARSRILRRRLWWSLVVRDNIISVGTGRPRTINLKDADVSPPSQDDFPVKNGKARLFLAYVTIIKILGDITECCLRKSLVPRRRLEFENALFRWIKRLRTDLQQPASGKPSDQHTPETRQLLVAYFAILAILYRSESPLSSPPAASLVASSLITGVFEEFLARDEIRHLGPVFAFYALCAGLAMVPAYRYPSLRRTAEYEISVIKLTLQELSKQWASAHGSLCALNKVIGEVQRQSSFNDPVPMVAPDVVPFFEDFGPVSCRQWKLVVGQQAGDYAVNMGDSRTGTPSILPDLRGSAAADRITPQGPTSSQTDSYAADNIAGGSPVLDLLGGGWEGSGFDWSGSWLLSDWGMNGINPGAAI